MTPEEYLAIFQGSDLAHGVMELLGTTDARGKQRVKCYTRRVRAGFNEADKHLNGVVGLGMPPINSNSMCRWGAIDVDSYQTEHTRLLTLMATTDSPLVAFKSKSGGLHLYLFLNGWIPAEDMLAILSKFASDYGLGECEIFPKQATLCTDENSADVGNWLNLPYFGRSQRPALTQTGEEVPFDQFAAYHASRMVACETALGWLKQPEESADEMPQPLPGGPPCLNMIMTLGVSEMRNETLASLAVYARKVSADGWPEMLHKFNKEFKPPLERKEVEALIKSYAKKEYRYKCSTQPLRRYCNPNACTKCKHGINGKSLEATATNRSLTKINTEPPIWYIEMEAENGNRGRVKLSTDELQTPRLFQRRVMEVMNFMPALPKADEWQEIISSLMKHVTVIDLPQDETPEGLFLSEVRNWLATRASKTSPDDMLRGVPYDDGEGFTHFQFKSLVATFKNNKSITLSQQEMQVALLNAGAERGRMRVSDDQLRVVTMPTPQFIRNLPAKEPDAPVL